MIFFRPIIVEHATMKDGRCISDREKKKFWSWKKAEQYMRLKAGNMSLECRKNGWTTFNQKDIDEYELFYVSSPARFWR